MRPKVVSAPLAVVRSRSALVPTKMLPANSMSPAVFCWGVDSPVNTDSDTKPSVSATPSTGIASAGCTSTTSPRLIWLLGTSVGWSATIRRAVFFCCLNSWLNSRVAAARPLDSIWRAMSSKLTNMVAESNQSTPCPRRTLLALKQ